MKTILIISGKGGTGKTTVTSALATVFEDKVIADCDVDAPDLHLLLNPEIKEKQDFYAYPIPVLNPEKCIKCNLCGKKCRFDAIYNGLVNEAKCEACALCVRICPENALILKDRKAGDIYIGETSYGKFVYAQLAVGQENSGKLVAQVKNIASEIATRNDTEILLVDGPPGIGCPVISALTQVDLVLMVVEPTESGFHDMKRLVDLINHFNLRSAVVINRYNVNLKITEEIEEYLGKRSIPVIGKIAYDPVFQISCQEGRIITEYENSYYTVFKELKNKIIELINI